MIRNRFDGCIHSLVRFGCIMERVSQGDDGRECCIYSGCLVEDRFLSSLVLSSTKQSISFATIFVHFGDSGFCVYCLLRSTPDHCTSDYNLVLFFVPPRTTSLRTLYTSSPMRDLSFT